MSKVKVKVTADDWYAWFLTDSNSGETVELPARLVTRWRKAYAEYHKVQMLLNKHLGPK